MIGHATASKAGNDRCKNDTSSRSFNNEANVSFNSADSLCRLNLNADAFVSMIHVDLIPTWFGAKNGGAAGQNRVLVGAL